MTRLQPAQSAFLLVAKKSNASSDRSYADLVNELCPRELGFDATHHISWHDDRNAVLVGAWSVNQVEAASSWHANGHGISVLLGHLRDRDGSRDSERDPLEGFAARSSFASPGPLTDQYEGLFAALAVSNDGDGFAMADPLGYRCMYYGDSKDVFVVSSRASLAARALCRTGEQPQRDPLGAAWLAYAKHMIGDRTGFTNVRVVPANAHVEVKRDVGVRLATRTPAWSTSLSVEDVGETELVRQARADIADALTWGVDIPATRHVVGLTGGKDSRLILAVMLAEGLTDNVLFQTIGGQALTDVNVASGLADTFGLQHEAGFPTDLPQQRYDDRLRGFVAATSGMMNVWHARRRAAPSGEVRIVGLCGELLRTFRKMPRLPQSKDDLLRLFQRHSGFGTLGLLVPEAAQQFSQEVLDRLLDDPTGTTPAADLLDAFYLGQRLRFTRVGPLEELNADVRLCPLYSITAIRSAFALGGIARQIELLHYRIMHSCAPELADLPFGGAGWHEMLTSEALRLTGDRPRLKPRREVPPKSDGRDESLISRLQRNAFADRVSTLRAIIQQDGSAWDVLDRVKVRQALERFPTLDGHGRQELYGAVTAVLWLNE